MSQAGYTLSDTMAALLIIGLAMSGLTAGLQVMNRVQATTQAAVFEASGAQRARQALDQLLAGQGPFRARDTGLFSGDATGFEFRCAPGKLCGAKIEGAAPNATLVIKDGALTIKSIKVSKMGDLSFAYVGSQAQSPLWPPATASSQSLRQVALLATGPKGEAPIAHVRVWSEQPAECAFDVVSQDCR